MRPSERISSDALFSTSPVALLHVRGDTVVASNDAAQALFATTAPLAGLRLSELFGSDGSISGRVRALRRDGTQLLVEVQFAPLSGNDHVLFLRAAHNEADGLVARFNEITRRIQSARSVDALLEAVGNGLIEAGYRCGAVRVVSNELVVQTLGPSNHVRAAAESAVARPVMGLSVPVDAVKDYARVVAAQRPVFVPDFGALTVDFLRVHSPKAADEFAARLDSLRMGSGFLVPIIVANNVWGVIGMYSPSARPEDGDAISLFGAQVGAAMDLAVSIDALERRNRQLSAINAVTRVAHGSFNAFASELCRIAAEGSGSDSSAIFLPEADGAALSMIASHAYSDDDQRTFGRQAVAGSVTGRVFATAAPRAMRLSDWPAHCLPMFEKAGINEMAVVPLRLQDRIIGTLNLRRTQPLPFTEQDLVEAEMLGAQIAVQLENARLYGETERRLQVLSALFNLSRLGNQAFDMRSVVDAALEKMEEAVDVDAAVAHLVGPGGLVLASHDRGNRNVQRLEHALTTLPLDEGSLSGCAAVRRELVTVAKAQWPPRTRDAANAVGLTVGAALPLLSGDRLVGTLCVSRVADRPFTGEELQLLWTCASYLSVCVEYLRLFEDERHRVEELKRLQAELVKRERLAALGELAAVVAHEVRNPLGVIFNSLSALRKARQVGAARDSEMLLDIVAEESERLNSIVGDLLDFARPIEPQLRRENLELILNGAIEVAASAANGRGGDVRVVLGDGAAAVPADARMLRQVFINLLVNAFQATPKGGDIRIVTTVENKEGRKFARVDVSDTGPGIPAELRQNIFQPFFTTKATGTGLGLAVVRRIVEAHHGEVSVDSQGQGTTFTVRLPLVDSASTRKATVAE